MGTPIVRYYFVTTLAPCRRLAVDLKSEPEAERVQRIIIKTCAKSVRGLRVFWRGVDACTQAINGCVTLL